MNKTTYHKLLIMHKLTNFVKTTLTSSNDQGRLQHVVIVYLGHQWHETMFKTKLCKFFHIVALMSHLKRLVALFDENHILNEKHNLGRKNSVLDTHLGLTKHTKAPSFDDTKTLAFVRFLVEETRVIRSPFKKEVHVIVGNIQDRV